MNIIKNIIKDTMKIAKQVLICSLSLIVSATLISAAHAEPTSDQSRDLKEPTSIDIRQDAKMMETLVRAVHLCRDKASASTLSSGMIG